MTARVNGALWLKRGISARDQLDFLITRREQLAVGRFAPRAVKIMQDGVPENYSAAMFDPYIAPDGTDLGTGIDFFSRDELLEAVPMIDAAGFPVHFHGIGDRAIRDCLDAVEAAIGVNGRTGNRHQIAHVQVVHPDDVPRFGQLGVAANMQMLWASNSTQMRELILPFLGHERSSWQYPFRSLQHHGAVLACGSDWSVSTPDPWAAIDVGVNRLPPADQHRTADVFLPDERLDLTSALAAYTSGSAWVNHADDKVGTIEVGKLADLVVIDRDPFMGEPLQIRETKVLQTFVGGERVYASEDA